MRLVLIIYSIKHWYTTCRYWLAQFCVLNHVALFVIVFSVNSTWAVTEPSHGQYETNAKMTVESLLPLAKAGDVTAQFNLGELYREGTNVIQNYGEAIKWFTRAAEQGDADAQHNLGM